MTAIWRETGGKKKRGIQQGWRRTACGCGREFAYKTLLGDQMNVIFREEATTAHTLGMTLEEYLSAQGGMSMEQAGHARIGAIEKMGASLTEEDEAALDKPKQTYGEGAARRRWSRAASRQARSNTTTTSKNSLYEGLTLGDVERTGRGCRSSISGNTAYTGTNMSAT